MSTIRSGGVQTTHLTNSIKKLVGKQWQSVSFFRQCILFFNYLQFKITIYILKLKCNLDICEKNYVI